jgi:hypothetical protein
VARIRIEEDPEITGRRRLGCAHVELDPVREPVLEEVATVGVNRGVATHARGQDVRLAELDARMILEEDRERFIGRKIRLRPRRRWSEPPRVGSGVCHRTVADQDRLGDGRKLGLAWRPSASAVVLRSLGSVTALVGALIVLAGWIESHRPCRPRWVNPCLPDVDGGSFALFVLDAAWVAAVCFIQAALSKPTDAIEHVPVGRPDVADAPSR